MFIGQLKKKKRNCPAFLTQPQNVSKSEMANFYVQFYSNTRLKVLMTLLQKF